MRLQELKALLEAHGLAPQARFGQNFLTDPALLAVIPQDAGVQAGERVIEIGPGAGALTERLLAAGAFVSAVELDHGLARLLRERFAAELGAGRLELIEGDALGPAESLHPELEGRWSAEVAGRRPPRLVANLPYSISGPFLARLPSRPLAGATLLLQREVAVKAAGPEGCEWSPLSIRLALAFSVELGRRVPPEVFWPRPQVESSFLHLRPRSQALAPDREALLAAVLRFGFGQRRKSLLPRLQREHPQWAAALRDSGVADRARPGEIGPEIWSQALSRLAGR
jgi:16S rRNA (adenine1518-N6/adenine1519-N6)-dimethyltransferase